MNRVSPSKESIKLYSMLQQVTLKGLRIPHSEFRIPTFHKANKNMADRVQITFHRLLPFLRWVKTIATWKTVIESLQSLGMDNYRVAFSRFLAFYSDNPSGLCDGETPSKWKVRQVSPLTPRPKLNGRHNL